MLKDDFYTIKENAAASEDTVNIVIQLNAEHAIYKGHFPQTPVVPGVCQVQIIKELLEDKLQTKLQLLSGDNIKFTGMIVPTQNAVVNIQMSFSHKENNVISAEARLFFEETTFTKFKGTFKPL